MPEHVLVNQENIGQDEQHSNTEQTQLFPLTQVQNAAVWMLYEDAETVLATEVRFVEWDDADLLKTEATQASN